MRDPINSGSAISRRVFLGGVASVLATSSAIGQVKLPPIRRTKREVLLANAATSTPQSISFTPSGKVHVGSPQGTLAGTVSVPSGTKVYGTNSSFSFDPDGANVAVKVGSIVPREPGRYRVSAYRVDATAPDVPLRTEVVPLVLPPQVSLGQPWTPYADDQLVVSGWHQEDLPDGPVAAWAARGILAVTAAQSDTAKQPVKTALGVEFKERSGASLQYPKYANRQILVRAHLTIFRLDPDSGMGSDPTVIVAPQGYQGSAFNRAGMLSYSRTGRRIEAVWRDFNGPNTCTAPEDVNQDYGRWAFALAYRIDGRHCLKVNGGPVVRCGTQVNPARSETEPSFIGIPTTTKNDRFAIDCRLELQGELSDAVIAKLEWWAAKRAGIALPADHPYATRDAVVDSDDFSVLVDKFDAGSWAKFTADAADKAFTTSNRGKPVPSAVVDAFSECVFTDDFRANSVARSDRSQPGIWYSQGGLAYNTVGADAALTQAGDTPNCYVHDPVAQTLELRAQYVNGRWWTGAIGTVNNADQGMTFRGPHMREVRFRMAIPPGTVAPAYFPAPLWAYGASRARIHTGLAFEFDDIELDGRDPAWLNGGSVHSHEGLIPGWNGRRTAAEDKDRVKLVGERINQSSGYPKNVNFFDGAWHTMRVYVGEDVTYFEVDGMEVRRCATPIEFFRRVHLISCLALVNGRGEPSRTATHGLVLDSVKVYKRPAEVAAWCAPFTARPTIGGSARVGQELVVSANLPSGSLVRYDFHHQDGYPLLSATENRYVLSKADIGKRIRCKVTALGATDQPEAWTDFTSTVRK